MAITRRDALMTALFGTCVLPILAKPVQAGAAQARAMALGGFGLDATQFGLRPGAVDDQSKVLSAALIEAAKRQQALFLPPGRYRVAGVALPEGARLMGVPGATQLVSAMPGPILAASKLTRVALSGLTLDGLKLRQNKSAGLLAIEDVAQLRLDDMSFANAGATGLMLSRCGGRVERSQFSVMNNIGLFSMDAQGLAVESNLIEDCGNNGIQIWRSTPGDDGTILTGNRISRIRNDDIGNGQYGNGISIFRAGGVIAQGNVLRDCAYTFIRNNGGSGVQMLGNNGLRCGEVGLYSEFAFEGCIISNNRVEDVAVGINITNLDQGGRLAVCSGNFVRRAKTGFAPKGEELIGGTGIHVEAEAAVSGNVVETATDIGISLGWSWAMRNITATGNVIRDTGIGIGVSLVPKERNVVVANNVISNARKGAVMGTEHGKIVTSDLTKGPDKRAAGVRVEGNAAG